MKRRNYCYQVLVLVLIALLLTILVSCARPTPTSPPPTIAPTSAPPMQKITLSVQSVYDATHGLTITLNTLLDSIEKKSNGALAFKRYPGSQLVPTAEGFKALKAGTVDMLLGTASFYSTEVPTGLVLWLPGLLKDHNDIWALYHKDGLEEPLQEYYAKYHNVRVVALELVPGEGIILMKKTTTLDGLRGKMLRVSGGLVTELCKQLGAVGVQLTGGDIYAGLQRGTVDGAILPLYTFESYKLKEIAKYALVPLLWPTRPVELFISLNAYNKLPRNLQDIMNQAAIEFEPIEVKYWIDYEREMTALAKQAGVEFLELSAADQAKLKEMGGPLWDKYEQDAIKDSGDVAKKIIGVARKHAGR